MTVVKWDQVQSDLQFLYLMSVPGQISNIRQAYNSYTRGDYAAARQASERGIQAITASAAVGLSLAFPSAARSAFKLGSAVHGSQSVVERPMEFGQHIFEEYKKGDLEAKDFAFGLFPEMARTAVNRYTTYDEARPTKSYEVVATNSTTSVGQKALVTPRPPKQSKRSSKAAVKGRCRSRSGSKKIRCTLKSGHIGRHKYS